MSNLFGLIDITKDPLYMKGFKEGKALALIKIKLENVTSLIINTELDDARIAFFMSASVDIVSETRHKLAKKKKKNGH